mgnify:FL=1
MILKKDLEIIMQNHEIWQAMQNLQKLYNQRYNGEEENKKYKYSCKLFRKTVEGEKGEVIPC